MSKFMAALVLGLAVTQAAQGAQNSLPTADRQPPAFQKQPGCFKFGPSADHGLRVSCSHPPNAIKVGASSDREQS